MLVRRHEQPGNGNYYACENQRHYAYRHRSESTHLTVYHRGRNDPQQHPVTELNRHIGNVKLFAVRISLEHSYAPPVLGLFTVPPFHYLVDIGIGKGTLFFEKVKIIVVVDFVRTRLQQNFAVGQNHVAVARPAERVQPERFALHILRVENNGNRGIGKSVELVALAVRFRKGHCEHYETAAVAVRVRSPADDAHVVAA